MDFDFLLGPSDEHLRLKSETDRRAAIRRSAPIGSEEWKRLSEEYNVAYKALMATPESQFESEAWCAENEADDLKRQMTSVLSLRPDEGQTIQSAIRDKSLSSRYATDREAGNSDPLAKRDALTIIADMRCMTPAQVAKALRMMAKQIDSNGMPRIELKPYWERSYKEEQTNYRWPWEGEENG